MKQVLDDGFSNSQEAALATMLRVILEWSCHCLTRWTYSTLLPHLNWDRGNTESEMVDQQPSKLVAHLGCGRWASNCLPANIQLHWRLPPGLRRESETQTLGPLSSSQFFLFPREEWGNAL